MAEVLPAVAAKQLNAAPSVRMQWLEAYIVFFVLPEGRKAAAGIEFFVRIKQKSATRRAGIQACGIFY